MSAREPIAPLSGEDREAALDDLAAWSFDGDDSGEGGAITRTFSFKNFSQAFAFMTRVALLAEKLDHHPEWTNVYATVIVRLTTHECDGVSERDIRMAKAMEKFL